MQVKVKGNHSTTTPIPDITVPVDPPATTPGNSPSSPVQSSPTPPVVTAPPASVPSAPINIDTGTVSVSSIRPTLAANLNPASGNVLQCGIFVPALNQWFSTQAVNGTNGTRDPYESVVLSRMNAAGTTIDSMTLLDAGHGTSFGVEVINGTPYIYLTYKYPADGFNEYDIVRFTYQPGSYDRPNVPNIVTMPKPFSGYNTLAFDWDNDLMVVRNSGGNRDNYYLRKISEWKNAVHINYGTVVLQQLPPTLQGFCTINDTLYRYIGQTNGEQLKPPEPSIIEQYSWKTGQRIDTQDVTGMGKTSLGVYPDNRHEPESCTMYREADGRATLCFSITLGNPGNHNWKMYKLPNIGDSVANRAVVTAPPVASGGGSFTLGSTKPTASNSGSGVLRAEPTGASGTKSGAQTLSGSAVLKGWVINGDVNMTGNSQLIDCIVHGRVKCTGSSGNPLVENCVIDGSGDYGASAGKSGGDVWLLQSTMTGGYANFRFNTVKSRTVTYKLNGIGYRNFRSYRNDVSQVVDGASITDTGATGIYMQGDYIHGLMFVSNDPNHSDFTHNDCLQVHGGTGSIIEGVNFEATQGSLKSGNSPYAPVVTGQAIGLTNDLNTATNITVKNSWLSGGAHAFTSIVNNNTTSNIGTLSNIRFGRNSRGNTAQLSSHQTVSASGLVYEDNGAAVTLARAES